MNVKIYGFNHSPWVQAVLLALHDKGIKHTVYINPPPEVLKKWGVYMPAVSINGGPWEIESPEILVKLGLESISKSDLNAVQIAWQGVLHRSDNPIRFFTAFSRVSETSAPLISRLKDSFLLSFICCYMFLLINFAKFKLKVKDPESFSDQFMFWEERLKLKNGPYIDGEEPGAADLLLFGVIQCHSSIPVPALNALQLDDRLSGLRKWIALMHERFLNYPYLYSGKFFEPFRPYPKSTNISQQVIFFTGVLTILISFPLTIPLIIALMLRAPRKNQKFSS